MSTDQGLESDEPADWPAVISKLPPNLRAVLGHIACGLDSGHRERDLLALAEVGLIVGYLEKLDGRPPVEVTRWELPLPVHMAWAQWCSQQPDEEGQ